MQSMSHGNSHGSAYVDVRCIPAATAQEVVAHKRQCVHVSQCGLGQWVPEQPFRSSEESLPGVVFTLLCREAVELASQRQSRVEQA